MRGVQTAHVATVQHSNEAHFLILWSNCVKMTAHTKSCCKERRLLIQTIRADHYSAFLKGISLKSHDEGFISYLVWSEFRSTARCLHGLTMCCHVSNFPLIVFFSISSQMWCVERDDDYRPGFSTSSQDVQTFSSKFNHQVKKSN